jgi:DNA mismatch endonuclease (patch repair protein)
VTDTQPELLLRKALHAQGLRYRLRRHVGRFRPDLVFPSARVAVFVDGCFWHGCPEHGAEAFRGPNAEKWRDKLAANKARDLRAVEELEALRWRVIRIWECDTKRDVALAAERVRQVVQEATTSAAPF